MNLMNASDIEKILAHFDPEQLIAAGAPKTEYAGEAEELAKEVAGCTSYKEIEQVVIEVFHRNFDFAYVLSDKPDGLAFTKHAIGKIDFSAEPAGLALTLKSQSDSRDQRASRVRGAAFAIFQFLHHGEFKPEDVTIKMTYQAPNEGIESKACVYLTDRIPVDAVRRVSIPALDSHGIERGIFTLQFNGEGRLLAIEVYGAITALPMDLLNKVWSAGSAIDLDPEILRNS